MKPAGIGVQIPSWDRGIATRELPKYPRPGPTHPQLLGSMDSSISGLMRMVRSGNDSSLAFLVGWTIAPGLKRSNAAQYASRVRLSTTQKKRSTAFVSGSRDFTVSIRYRIAYVPCGFDLAPPFIVSLDQTGLFLLSSGRVPQYSTPQRRSGGCKWGFLTHHS